MKASDLIKYVVWLAGQNNVQLTTNRLVKFIYLMDLYNARLRGGQTLTGFPWKFIYYGPYCADAMQNIDQAVYDGLICKSTYESYFKDGGEYALFSCDDDDAEAIGEELHIGIVGQINKALREFGDDTPKLLDYVYFETEPMEGVKKGDFLDFSKAQFPEPIERVELKKLSPEAIKLARQKIKQLSDEVDTNREDLLRDEQETQKYKDEAYYKFLEQIDDEDLKTGLKGRAKIKI